MSVTRRTTLIVAILGWACYSASLFMRALVFEGGEFFDGTWSGWNALTRGWVVWAVPFASFNGDRGLIVVLASFWLGALWLTNCLVLLSPSLVLRAWTKVSIPLRRALPVAAVVNVTFVLAPDVHPAPGYYFWLASFGLLSLAARAEAP